MRILRAANHRRMPWKNGGGVTTEIAVHPQGAGMDAFEWRLSMALVEQDGPFSLFPGVDRILAVLDGEGIGLSIGSAPQVVLGPGSTPLSFAADVPVFGKLVGGAVSDLNLMARRNLSHSMRRFAAQQGTRIQLAGRWNLLFNSGAGVWLSVAGTLVELDRFDAVAAPDEIELEITLNSSAGLFAIEIG